MPNTLVTLKRFTEQAGLKDSPVCPLQTEGKKTEQPGGQAMGSHLSLDQSSEGGGDTVTLGRLVHLLVEYI